MENTGTTTTGQRVQSARALARLQLQTRPSPREATEARRAAKARTRAWLEAAR